MRLADARQALRRFYRRSLAAWLLALPAIVVFVVFKWYLTLLVIWETFRQIGLFGSSTWVGLANFQTLLTTPGFLGSVGSTVAWVAVGLLMTVLPALALALALENPPAKAFWRAIYFVPGLFSWAMEGPIWVYLLTPDQGPIATLFRVAGVAEPNWLTAPSLIFFVLGALLLWQQGGFLALFYLASLASVNQELLDAARVDGARRWRRFWWVVFPLLIPTVGVVTTVVLLQTFSGFSELYTVTSAAVYNTTNILTLWIYNHGIVADQIGIGAAASLLLFLMTLVVTVIGLRRTESRI